jgi:phage shock protein PspC (stress-responsive transcriptional regulator)
MSTTPPAPESAASRMRRPQDDRWLAGVCAGIARELGIDPLAVRIGVILLSLFGGAGVLIYLLGVLLIPAAGEQDSMLRKAIDGDGRPLVLGLLLVGVVLWAVVTEFVGAGFGPGWGFGWLVVAGAGLLFFLFREDRRRERVDAAAPAEVDAAAPAEVDAEAPTAITGEPAPRPPRSGGRIALGVTLVGIAIVGAIGAIGGDDVRWDILLASTVIALGAALVIAAPFGGARALIPLGLLLAAGTGIAAAADLELKGGAGERVYRPEYVADIKPEYQLAAGRQEIDLRNLALPDGTTKVKIEQGFGETVVRLPERARVSVQADVAGGEIEVLGRESNGFDADLDVAQGDAGEPLIEIDAHLGFGYIGIVRGNDRVGRDHNRHFPGAIALGAIG